ncbi:hypothetical protein WJX72_007741 [[Myrmecia] bisecta]|uniref:Major facilitator superfamily (MFS) profile domain-containing protein n=1 Tax=[Myrmecia] bisecta TaxID=41462 RepID=A0AAW1Q1G4_9CHLO
MPSTEASASPTPVQQDTGADVEQQTLLQQQASSSDVAFEVDISDSNTKQHSPVDERVVLRKLDVHLVCPFLLLIVLCYIDRTNLAFAALELNADLGFTDSIYGRGSGVFFVGYMIFQIPSNLILVRIGARKWLAAIIVAWGLVAICFATLRNPVQFYILRFLLGAAESGTLPGMWYHLTGFYSKDEMSVAWSWMMVGIAVSQVVGGPLAAGLLALDGVLGLDGWQWLFILEGVPTVLMGLYIFMTLTESALQATFLTPAERNWLFQRQARQAASLEEAGAQSTSRQALVNFRVWYGSVMMLLGAIPKYSLLYWLPLIVKSLLVGPPLPADTHHDGDAMEVEPADHNQLVALLCALPFAVSAISIYFTAQHSKKTGERKLHVAVPWAVGAVCLLSLAVTMGRNDIAAFATISCATVVWAGDAVMASWPATYLSGPAAATAAALINSIGSIGGVVGPILIGELKEKTGNYIAAMGVLAGVAALMAIMAANFPELPTPVDGTEVAEAGEQGLETKALVQWAEATAATLSDERKWQARANKDSLFSF